MSESTIVTAYYEIPSKAPKSTYLNWINNFLKNIENNIVFFTSEDLVDYFKSVRNENIIYKVLPFGELNAIKKYGYDFWKKQKEIDVWRYHTPELGIIWYEKKEFVLRVIEENPFNTDYFIWCDAGCMRHSAYFPSINTFGKNLSNIDKDKLNFQVIGPLQNKSFYAYPDICIAGAIIVGKKETWYRYKELYDKILQEYVNANISCLMDQYIMVSMLEKYKDEFSLIYPTKKYIDVWFFFLEELSL